MSQSYSFANDHFIKILRKLAGPDAVPREDQIDAVHSTIQQNARVLVVQATGWGKSAVYWAATSALRSQGAGPTLIVSPLLALMRNQVEAATKAGLCAATINSSNIDNWDEIFESLKSDSLDVLLISPERLGNERFAEQQSELMERVGLVVIDEAHCISDWGFDFRPDYQRLAKVLLSNPSVSVLATTATANKRVTDDINSQLGPSSVVYRGTLARTSLQLAVVPNLKPIQRYAWVAHVLNDLPGSGIIYVLTVADAEKLASFLKSCGYDVLAYTGRMDAFERTDIEDRLRKNEIKAVVATSALGMGYDKPDLGFCLHVGSPSNPVAYYQQVGRAGRGLDHAVAVLLSGNSDERIWEFFASSSIPDSKQVDIVLQELASKPQSIIELDGLTGIRRSRLETLLKILAIEEVVVKSGPKWSSTGKPYVHDYDKWNSLLEVRQQEANIMRQYAHGRGCLMEYLQIALDDPSPAPCGKCSVCTGIAPGPGAKPDNKWLMAAREFSRGEDTVIETRKRWPGGVLRKGNIFGIAEGRAVAFADDPGWEDPLTELSRSKYTNIPSELIKGAQETIDRWAPNWTDIPVAVVPAPAFGAEANANRQLAKEIATHLRLPVVDALIWNGDELPTGISSSPIVAHLDQVLTLRDGIELPEAPVLLCATSMRTGWTQTVAAELLHQVGVTQALPLVIHKRPVG